MVLLLCRSSKSDSQRVWFAVGEKNSLCELKSPRFGPKFQVTLSTSLSRVSIFKTQKVFSSLLEEAAAEVTELLPALMSIFIIVNVFTAEMSVQHPCAILESELIMLFYKMIIVGLFGFFF